MVALRPNLTGAALSKATTALSQCHACDPSLFLMQDSLTLSSDALSDKQCFYITLLAVFLAFSYNHSFRPLVFSSAILLPIVAPIGILCAALSAGLKAGWKNFRFPIQVLGVLMLTVFVVPYTVTSWTCSGGFFGSDGKSGYSWGSVNDNLGIVAKGAMYTKSSGVAARLSSWWGPNPAPDPQAGALFGFFGQKKPHWEEICKIHTREIDLNLPFQAVKVTRKKWPFQKPESGLLESWSHLLRSQLAVNWAWIRNSPRILREEGPLLLSTLGKWAHRVFVTFPRYVVREHLQTAIGGLAVFAGYTMLEYLTVVPTRIGERIREGVIGTWREAVALLEVGSNFFRTVWILLGCWLVWGALKYFY